jgi:hypothetical protein
MITDQSVDTGAPQWLRDPTSLSDLLIIQNYLFDYFVDPQLDMDKLPDNMEIVKIIINLLAKDDPKKWKPITKLKLNIKYPPFRSIYD